MRLEARDGGAYLIAAGEAAPAYPGLLRKFVRTIVVLPPDRVVIRDVVDSVAASSSPTVPATVDNAWNRIVVDLRAAGCRSVAPSAPS